MSSTPTIGCVPASRSGRAAAALALATALLGDVGSSAFAGAAFRGLGDLPGGSFSSQAFGISPDGSVVVGRSSTASGNEAFRWSLGSGLIALTDLDGGSTNSTVYAASAGGNVIVGSGSNSSGTRAARAAAGSDTLNSFTLIASGSAIGSVATDVSADGSVIVGRTGAPGTSLQHAFRWTATEGVALDLQPEGLPDDHQSRAAGVSADGSVVVGDIGTSDAFHVFRWIAFTGMINLGRLTPTSTVATQAISSDGSTIVGWDESPGGGVVGFRWTADTGLVSDIGSLGGSTQPFAVSANGSVIVGTSSGQAFIWDATQGIRSLKSFLVSDFELGDSLQGWTLTQARGISDDGSVIVGVGTNPNGMTEAWIVEIPIPEPAALTALSSLALILLSAGPRLHRTRRP